MSSSYFPFSPDKSQFPSVLLSDSHWRAWQHSGRLLRLPVFTVSIEGRNWNISHNSKHYNPAWTRGCMQTLSHSLGPTAQEGPEDLHNRQRFFQAASLSFLELWGEMTQPGPAAHCISCRHCSTAASSLLLLVHGHSLTVQNGWDWARRLKHWAVMWAQTLCYVLSCKKEVRWHCWEPGSGPTSIPLDLQSDEISFLSSLSLLCSFSAFSKPPSELSSVPHPAPLCPCLCCNEQEQFCRTLPFVKPLWLRCRSVAATWSKKDVQWCSDQSLIPQLCIFPATGRTLLFLAPEIRTELTQEPRLEVWNQLKISEHSFESSSNFLCLFR